MRRGGACAWSLAWLASCLALAVPSLAADEPVPGEVRDCSDPVYRRLDFRIGEFEVTTATGLAAGQSRVEALLGGCLLVEHWRGALGGAGRAHYFLERSTSRWRMFFVNDEGMTLYLVAPAGADPLVFAGMNAFGQLAGLHTMTFLPDSEGGVRQLWQLSVDDGRTWETVLDGRYARRPSSAVSLPQCSSEALAQHFSLSGRCAKAGRVAP